VHQSGLLKNLFADHPLLDHRMILLGMNIYRVTGPERLQTKTILDYDGCLGADF
jgi:hypothetical protein